MVYCDFCYDVQAVHDSDRNRSGSHEKTELNVANFVLCVFDTVVPLQERDLQHHNNIYSKWFGAVIDDHNKSYFHDFGGFARLLQDSEIPPSDFYPSLISFVGDTGEGKSTVINGILRV